MLNRFLFLLVAVIAPASCCAMLFGPHPAAVVTVAERLPCLALALVALALAVLHSSPTTDRSAPFEAAMWLGLTALLVVAAFASPHLGVLGVVALLTLAGTSVARLAARARSGLVTASPFRRRIFA